MVYFTPMPQFKMAKVEHNYNFLYALFEECVKNEKFAKEFTLASGYLNLPNEFISLLKEAKLDKLTFFGAAPEVIF